MSLEEFVDTFNPFQQWKPKYMRNESAPKLKSVEAPKLNKSSSNQQMLSKMSPKKTIPLKAYDSRDRLNKSQVQIKKIESVTALTNVTNLNFSSPNERRSKKARNCSSKQRMTTNPDLPEYDTQDARNYLMQLSKENN